MTGPLRKVPKVGLEPTRPVRALDFESSASASSATSAFRILHAVMMAVSDFHFLVTTPDYSEIELRLRKIANRRGHFQSSA